MIDEKEFSKRKPDPSRVAVLRKLPPEIMAELTKEEVNAFLFEAVWPDTLKDKLKDYLE